MVECGTPDPCGPINTTRDSVFLKNDRSPRRLLVTANQGIIDSRFENAIAEMLNAGAALPVGVFVRNNRESDRLQNDALKTFFKISARWVNSNELANCDALRSDENNP